MKKVILLILDGFGINKNDYGNAINKANTPTFDMLLNTYPNCELEASGTFVGLPKGQMGNSEVGHLTIGSGKINYQPLTYINDQIKNKEFFKNEKLNELMDYVNENNSTLHLIGLLSNGGVHSSINHFYAALALAKLKNVKKVVFHFITDGRDTPVTSGKDFLAETEEKIADFEERYRKEIEADNAQIEALVAEAEVLTAQVKANDLEYKLYCDFREYSKECGLSNNEILEILDIKHNEIQKVIKNGGNKIL